MSGYNSIFRNDTQLYSFIQGQSGGTGAFLSGNLDFGGVSSGYNSPFNVPYTAYKDGNFVIVHIGYFSSNIQNQSLYIQTNTGALPALYRPNPSPLNPLTAGIAGIISGSIGSTQISLEVNIFPNGQIEINKLPLDFFLVGQLLTIYPFSLSYLVQ